MDKRIIEQEALQLPETARGQLAEKLLASLDDSSDAEIKSLWLDEAESRSAEIDNGNVELISSEDAATEVREILE